MGTERLGSWLVELGLLVGADAVRKAPSTAARLVARPAPRDAVRPWALVDYEALDLFLALVTVRFDGPRADVLGGLERLRGVVDVLGVRDHGEALVTVVFERRGDRAVLERDLAEFGDVVEWREIDEHLPTAAITTFRSFARTAARSELLLAAPYP